MIETKWQRRNMYSGNEALYLSIMALMLFMFGIWQQPFINFETRFAVFAQEMLRNGLSLFPTTYGQPYPDYPVTSTILIWLFSLPFGQVTKFSAVLPTALASAIVVGLTYKLFAQYSKRWGLLAVGFEFLTVTFCAESRSISVDQMVSAITLAAFYLTHKSYREKLALPIMRLSFLLIAGFLIRGPVGIVIPAGVVLSHLFLTGERREIVSFVVWSGVILIACTSAMLGLAMLVYGKDFVVDIIRMQAVGRFSESVPHPIYYYVISSFGNYALSYPIALIAALGILLDKFRTKSPIANKEHALIVMLLLAWTAIVLVGLSIPETKKARYILSIAPALAGLASYIFIGTDYPFMKWMRRLVEVILLLLPFLATVLLYTQKKRFDSYGIDISFSIFIFVLLFIISISIFVFSRKRISDISLPLCSIGVLTTIYLQIAIVEPVDLYLHDTSASVHRLESLREKQPGSLVFYKENPDGFPINYLVNARVDFLPQFITDLEALKSSQSPVWLLTKDKYIDDLKKVGIDAKSVIYRERFGKAQFLIVYIPANSEAPAREQKQ
jgi:4-amino-4-deoxy-L-arabinose transferase-like glycosyltransferase